MNTTIKHAQYSPQSREEKELRSFLFEVAKQRASCIVPRLYQVYFLYVSSLLCGSAVKEFQRKTSITLQLINNRLIGT